VAALQYRRPYVRDVFFLLAVLVRSDTRIKANYKVNLSRLAKAADIDRKTARNQLDWLHEHGWIEWEPSARTNGTERHNVRILVDNVHGGMTVNQWVETFRYQWRFRLPLTYERMH